MVMKAFAVLLLVLAACEPGPDLPYQSRDYFKPPKHDPVYLTCDYCKKQRSDARIYACRKCGYSHFSCKAEAPLHAADAKLDKAGGVAGRSIKVCPEGAVK